MAWGLLPPVSGSILTWALGFIAPRIFGDVPESIRASGVEFVGTTERRTIDEAAAAVNAGLAIATAILAAVVIERARSNSGPPDPAG